MGKFHSIAALCGVASGQNCKHCSTDWRSTLTQSYLFVTTASPSLDQTPSLRREVPRPSLSGWQIETLGEGEESQASGMDAFG